MFAKTHKNLKSGLTLAALALTASVCPAQAQFNNGFNAFGQQPQMLTPLGGGVAFSNFNNGFGNSFGTGFTGNVVNPFGAQTFGGFNSNGFSSGAFNNSAFSTSPFNNGAFVGTSAVSPFLNGQSAGFSTIPTNGFNQPVASFNPLTGTVPSVDPGLSFQANPGFSPFPVNGAFNSGSAFNAFNTGFGNNSLATQAQLNNQFNSRPQPVFRAAPLYNPTVPNAPASLYPATANAAGFSHPMAQMNQAGQMGQGNTTVRQYPWYQAPPTTYPSRLQILNQTGSTSQNSSVGQVRNNQYNWYQAPPTTYPSRLQILGQTGATGMTSSAGQVRNGQYNWYQNPPTTYPSRLFILNNSSPKVGMGNGANVSMQVIQPVTSFGNPGLRMMPIIGGPPTIAGGNPGLRFAPVIGGPPTIAGSGSSIVFGGRAR